MAKGDFEGLSIWYRISYGIRWLVFMFFGPAQLNENSDPHARLARERRRKVAAIKEEREAREAAEAERLRRP